VLPRLPNVGIWMGTDDESSRASLRPTALAPAPGRGSATAIPTAPPPDAPERARGFRVSASDDATQRNATQRNTTQQHRRFGELHETCSCYVSYLLSFAREWLVRGAVRWFCRRLRRRLHPHRRPPPPPLRRRRHPHPLRPHQTRPTHRHTAQHSTAQHSTAQHSTAQHSDQHDSTSSSSAQHSAQHSAHTWYGAGASSTSSSN
jgi:hypothetical protein